MNQDSSVSSASVPADTYAILFDIGAYSVFIIQVLIILCFIIYVPYCLVKDRKGKGDPRIISKSENTAMLSRSKTEREVYRDTRYNLAAMIFTPITLFFWGLVVLIIVREGLVWDAIILMIIVDIGTIFLFLYFRRIITINSSRLSICYGVGIRQITLPLKNIRSYDILKVNFHERYRRRRYYSWRLNTNTPGFSFIFRSDGLETIGIRMKKGRKYDIWTDEAHKLIRGIKEGKGARFVGDIEVEVREGARAGLR